MPPVKKRLGDILLEMGVVDEMQLQAAMGHVQQWGGTLGRALVDKGFCKPEQIMQALSKQTGHPLIDLDAQALDSRLAFALGVKAAEKHRAVPLRLEGKRSEVLVVGVAAPADMATLDAIRAVSGRTRVVPYLASDAAIERAIGKLYYGRQPEAPAPPPPQAKNRAEIQGEQEVVLEQEPGEDLLPPGPPVLIYGWKDAAANALVDMLKKAGVTAKIATEEDVLGCTPADTVISTSLSLEALLPIRQRLPGRVVVAGMPNDEDMQQAKAVGAKVYLKSPLNAEQLIRAVKKTAH